MNDSISFPSEAIKDWCHNIQKLIDAPREGKTSYDDGFCACEVEKAILYAPHEQQPQLISGLFWSIWIDQVMYYVLVDGGIHGFEPDKELYKKYRSKYRFPKLYVHSGPGHSSPHFLLSQNANYQTPNNELLEEDRRDFWCNVKDWLKGIHRDDVIDAALSAFQDDINTRFNHNYDFLINNLDCEE